MDIFIELELKRSIENLELEKILLRKTEDVYIYGNERGIFKMTPPGAVVRSDSSGSRVRVAPRATLEFSFYFGSGLVY